MSSLGDGIPLVEWEFLRGDLGGIWEALRPAAPGSPEAALAWAHVSLPHCYNARDAVDPDEPYYQGPAWYRRKLAARNPFPGGRSFLRFAGAGRRTRVYLSDALVASHEDGYDEWSVDLTDRLPPDGGEASLAVRCDNSRDLEALPSDLSDFAIYGGLYRPVSLVQVPALYVDELEIRSRAEPGGSWTVRIAASLAGEPRPGASLEIRIVDPRGGSPCPACRLEGAAPGRTEASFSIASPELWSPDRPALYSCLVELRSPAGLHSVRRGFGLRSFEFLPHGPFMLNGERLLLRGTHRHEDHAGLGAALTEELMLDEIEAMKEMGVNFLRLGHYQQSEAFLELCDRKGILVWEEIPWCRGGLGGEAYREQARRMLGSMVRQHARHPSIIVWGLGNELDWPGDFPRFDEGEIRAFLGELRDLCRGLDDSRPTAIRRCGFCKDLVDVYSPSIWAGWYRGLYTDYRRVSEEEAAEVERFLHMEWGGDSHAGRHAEDPYASLGSLRGGGGADERAGDAAARGGEARVSRDGDWSETYFCDLVDWHLTEQERMPWLTGSAFWVFKDFATPLRPENPVPYVNQKGVLARDGTRKESYYLFQSRWAKEPMIHIYGHGWPVRWGAAGEPKEVRVFSNCAEVELFLDGESLGRRVRDLEDFPAAGLRWAAAFREGEHRLRAVAEAGGRLLSDELAFTYQAGAWGAPAALRLSLREAEGALAWVEVELRDERGLVCLDAAGRLRFSLAGDGELVDDQGTPWGSRLVQAANGRGKIAVRRRGGRSAVAVAYPGLATAILEV